MINNFTVKFIYDSYQPDTSIDVKAESPKHAVEIAKKMIDNKLLQIVTEIDVHEHENK